MKFYFQNWNRPGALYFVGLVPGSWTFALGVMDRLGPDPIQALEHDPLVRQVLAGAVARLEGLASDGPAGHDPQSRSAEREQYAALCEGIDALSETLRTTLVLVCIDGVSHEDAATILGAPEGTIAWRVHEARRKLKEFMESRGFGPEVPADPTSTRTRPVGSEVWLQSTIQLR